MTISINSTLKRIANVVTPAKVNTLVSAITGGPQANSYAVADLPAAAANKGRIVHCTNGDAGAACAAMSDGTNWKVMAFKATVSAT